MPFRVTERSLVVLLLVILTSMAGWLRVSTAAREPLWLDELHTAYVVAGDWNEISARAQLGSQSPGYFYLTWLSVQSMGLNTWSLRLLSLVCGTLLIPLVFWAGRLFTGSAAVGLIAAAWATVDEHCLFYSQEARAYALVQLGVVAHWILLWQAMRNGTWPWRVAWVMLGAALWHLHITVSLVFAAELAYVGLLAISRADQRWKIVGQWCVLFGALALLCLPSLPHLQNLAAERLDWKLFVTPPTIWECLTLFPWEVYLLAPLLFAAPRLGRRENKGLAATDAPPGDFWLLCGCWMIVPVALAIAATWTDFAPLFVRRYVLGSAAAPMLCGAALSLVYKSTQSRCAFALAAVVAAVLLNPNVRSWATCGEWPVSRNELWHEAVAHLSAAKEAPRLVFVQSFLVECDRYLAPQLPSPEERNHCLSPVLTLYQFGPKVETHPLPNTRAENYLAERFAMRIRAERGCWLLVRGDSALAAELSHAACQTLAQHDVPARVRETHSFGDLTAVWIEVKSP